MIFEYDDYFSVSVEDEPKRLNEKNDGFEIEKEFQGAYRNTNGKASW